MVAFAKVSGIIQFYFPPFSSVRINIDEIVVIDIRNLKTSLCYYLIYQSLELYAGAQHCIVQTST